LHALGILSILFLIVCLLRGSPQTLKSRISRRRAAVDILKSSIRKELLEECVPINEGYTFDIGDSSMLILGRLGMALAVVYVRSRMESDRIVLKYRTHSTPQDIRE
jgi:hypothetical protein